MANNAIEAVHVNLTTRTVLGYGWVYIHRANEQMGCYPLKSAERLDRVQKIQRALIGKPTRAQMELDRHDAEWQETYNSVRPY